MSSSRLQLLIWFLAIIPGLVAVMYINVAANVSNPLSIAIPSELWVLLGVSGGSVVGAAAVNDATNRNKKPTEKALGRAKITTKEDIAAKTVGILCVNDNKAQASARDVFMGDEVGNCEYLDISKVQMILVTIGLAVGYGFGILLLIAQTTPPINLFPPIDPNLVILLAISQGTYLGYKAAPHTDTTPSP